MPRPRAYADADVLERALGVFWRYGYEGASIQALVDATGLNRSSLYHAYADKQALYRAALDHFRRTAGAQGLPDAFETAPVREAFRAVLGAAAATACAPERPGGCFVVHAALDRAPHDAETRARVAEGLAATEALFRARLERARAEGELSATADAARLARYFVAVVNGLRVTAAGAGGPAALGGVVETALAALDA